MPASPPLRRLYLALTASVLLHAALLGAGDPGRFFAARPRLPSVTVLHASLPPLPNEAALLKNTLGEAQGQASPPTAPAAVTPPLVWRERTTERKLAEHLFYPPEAIAKGLEGEVRLLLTLDPQGRIIEAQIASSSGHGLLDRAAAEAAYAMHRLPDAGVRELILPVVFKLQ